MKTLKDIEKRHIMVLDRGICLGRPADILLDTDKHRIAALVLTKTQRPEVWTVIPARAVHDFDADDLTIDSLNSVGLAFDDENLLHLAVGAKGLKGRPVLTRGGRNLGKVARVIVDELGRVREYHLRRGLLGLIGRTHRIGAEDLGAVGEDFAVLAEN
jgi:sporulation protein YlmC with PRC-barrel domain